MAILLFAGVDKVGKSTLFKGVLKNTNRHICVDRFTACQCVYGSLHNKKDTPKIEQLTDFEHFLKYSPIPVGFILVEANTEEIIKRFKMHDEKDIELKQIDIVKTMYRDYFKYSHLPVFVLDTTGKEIDYCTNLIIEFGDRLDRKEIFI
jgi:thymidylate kinase